MFDPLANFKLNKIKKGVDSVKAAVDALPTSLSSSFTDVKNAISGVSTKVDGVGTKVDGVGLSVDYLKENNIDYGALIYKKINLPETDTEKEVFSVSGSGEIYLIYVDNGNTSGSFAKSKIYTDGSNIHNMYSYQSSGSYCAGISIKDLILSIMKETYYYTTTTPFCSMHGPSIMGDFDTYKQPNIANDKIGTNQTRILSLITPLRFNSSFRVVCPYVNDTYSSLHVVYKLD